MLIFFGDLDFDACFLLSLFFYDCIGLLCYGLLSQCSNDALKIQFFTFCHYIYIYILQSFIVEL